MGVSRRAQRPSKAADAALSVVKSAGGRVRAQHNFRRRPAMDAAGRTSANLTPNPHHWDAGNACACTLACMFCGVIKSEGARGGGARRGENRVRTGRPLACSLEKKKKITFL